MIQFAQPSESQAAARAPAAVSPKVAAGDSAAVGQFLAVMQAVAAEDAPECAVVPASAAGSPAIVFDPMPLPGPASAGASDNVGGDSVVGAEAKPAKEKAGPGERQHGQAERTSAGEVSVVPVFVSFPTAMVVDTAQPSSAQAKGAQAGPATVAIKAAVQGALPNAPPEADRPADAVSAVVALVPDEAEAASTGMKDTATGERRPRVAGHREGSRATGDNPATTPLAGLSLLPVAVAGASPDATKPSKLALEVASKSPVARGSASVIAPGGTTAGGKAMDQALARASIVTSGAPSEKGSGLSGPTGAPMLISIRSVSASAPEDEAPGEKVGSVATGSVAPKPQAHPPVAAAMTANQPPSVPSVDPPEGRHLAPGTLGSRPAPTAQVAAPTAQQPGKVAAKLDAATPGAGAPEVGQADEHGAVPVQTAQVPRGDAVPSLDAARPERHAERADGAQAPSADGARAVAGATPSVPAAHGHAPPHDAGAAPQRAADATPMEQIARHVTTAGATRSTELTLSPPELGPVRVTVSGDAGAMTVAIHVGRPETLDLLRGNVHLLHQEFRDMGFSGATFSFGAWTGGGGAAANGAGAGGGGPPQQATGGPASAGAGLPSSAAFPPPATRTASASGLDLRL